MLASDSLFTFLADIQGDRMLDAKERQYLASLYFNEMVAKIEQGLTHMNAKERDKWSSSAQRFTHEYGYLYGISSAERMKISEDVAKEYLRHESLDTDVVASEATEIANKYGVPFDPSTDRATLHSLSEARAMAHMYMRDAVAGEVEEFPAQYALQERPFVVQPVFAAPVPSIAPPKAVVTLRQAMNKYFAVKVDSGEWTKGSAKDAQPQLNRFVAFIGEDRDISGLTNDDMRHFLKCLRYLPSQRYRDGKIYKTKTIAQLLKMAVPEDHKYSAKSVKNHLDTIRSFINWAEGELYIDRAAPLNKQLRLPKDLTEALETPAKRAFTDAELLALFDPSRFNRQRLSGAKYWAPLIGLFTGMRIEEICQLYREDIKPDGELYYIDINSNDEKQLKTRSSRRCIPIHSFLIEAGLLAYRDSLKNTKWLFPELHARESAGNRSGSVVQWFTRHRRECGVGGAKGERSDVSFHCFRHTIATVSKLSGFGDAIRKEILGHAKAGDVTDRNYDGRYHIQSMYDEVISKLDWVDRLGLRRVLE